MFTSNTPQNTIIHAPSFDPSPVSSGLSACPKTRMPNPFDSNVGCGGLIAIPLVWYSGCSLHPGLDRHLFPCRWVEVDTESYARRAGDVPRRCAAPGRSGRQDHHRTTRDSYGTFGPGTSTSGAARNERRTVRHILQQSFFAIDALVGIVLATKIMTRTQCGLEYAIWLSI